MQTCVGCTKSAPETDTNYTLISAQFGWRLARLKQADGTVTLEWRCPQCWREYKRSRSGASLAAEVEAAASHQPSHETPPSSRPARVDTAIRRRLSLPPVGARETPAPPSATPRRPGRSSR